VVVLNLIASLRSVVARIRELMLEILSGSESRGSDGLVQGELNSWRQRQNG
jgi:hypothetical protein